MAFTQPINQNDAKKDHSTISWFGAKRQFSSVDLLKLAATLGLLVVCLVVCAPAARGQEPSITWEQLQTVAIDQILTCAQAQDPFLRANAIEAAQHLPQRVMPLVQRGLDDPHPAVRFAALATAGKLQLIQLAPACARLLEDDATAVRAAALFALRRCGQKIDITPLAQMLISQDPSLRGNVAMLLGMMGDPSATPMLKELARYPMPRASAVQEAIVRIQTAEALVKLGDDSALSALRSGAFAQFDEVRVLAVSMMGQLHDQRMEKAFIGMLDQPPIELQIAAAASLAHTRRFDGLSIVLNACDSQFPTVRAQAAIALALFPRPQAQPSLEKLLTDPDQTVRLAAAAAVCRYQDEEESDG